MDLGNCVILFNILIWLTMFVYSYKKGLFNA